MRHGIKLSLLAVLVLGMTTVTSYAQDITSTVSVESQAATNKAASAAFLAANQKKPGVITLSNGLQYKIIAEGKGESPKDTDSVVVNYKGTTIDGKQFDSSYDRGQPATFPVNAVIPGWTQALKLMKPGAKWELYIPAELAYGDQGVPGTGGEASVIGPDQALIFTVELISVNKQ